MITIGSEQFLIFSLTRWCHGGPAAQPALHQVPHPFPGWARHLPPLDGRWLLPRATGGCQLHERCPTHQSGQISQCYCVSLQRLAPRSLDPPSNSTQPYIYSPFQPITVKLLMFPPTVQVTRTSTSKIEID